MYARAPTLKARSRVVPFLNTPAKTPAEFMMNKAKDDELAITPFVCYEKTAAKPISMMLSNI
ncbi:MAG: hypothetical protein DSY37_01070 [Hyperthermus sp.]|nr:MAG: hypothetical protein DSY37_01070 [Hyperthermus sp.]